MNSLNNTVNNTDRIQNKVVSPPDSRTSMSDGTWGIVLTVTETILDVIKAFVVIGGVIAFNMADFVLGTIGIGLVFDQNVADSFNVNVWLLGAIPSLGASAIQIFLWSLIKKRGVTFKQILKWKIPNDIKAFFVAAIAVWLIDTVIDISPLSVMMSSERYAEFPDLYRFLAISVGLLLFIMCGFAEGLTTNMRGMLMITSERDDHPTRPKQAANTNNTLHSNMPRSTSPYVPLTKNRVSSSPSNIDDGLAEFLKKHSEVRWDKNRP